MSAVLVSLVVLLNCFMSIWLCRAFLSKQTKNDDDDDDDADDDEGKTIFFEAPETVWWLDLTDHDPFYFTTDLRHC